MKNLRNLQIDKLTVLQGIKLTCRRTYDRFHCGVCYFKEKGENCPQGVKDPLCFATEREDLESVYFQKSKGKIV